MDSLLTVDSLQVQFNTKKGINTAVDGISFSVGKGYWESWENRAAVRA